MPLLAPLLAALAMKANAIVAGALDSMDRRARVRRERASLLDLDAMGDDRLRDVGLTRDAIRCGLRDRRSPMRAAWSCARGSRELGGLYSRRWGDPVDWPDRPDRMVTYVRYLGW